MYYSVWGRFQLRIGFRFSAIILSPKVYLGEKNPTVFNAEIIKVHTSQKYFFYKT